MGLCLRKFSITLRVRVYCRNLSDSSAGIDPVAKARVVADGCSVSSASAIDVQLNSRTAGQTPMQTTTPRGDGYLNSLALGRRIP
jgi:hypothetical protein